MWGMKGKEFGEFLLLDRSGATYWKKKIDG